MSCSGYFIIATINTNVINKNRVLINKNTFSELVFPTIIAPNLEITIIIKAATAANTGRESMPVLFKSIE
ncbi:MAG: hypothetical protein HON94_14725 [Methylococcales bacterium]|nr:hypothetical protein [Methylococcales bacterium]MBT7410340.1 hypothetical protein [Methylococcales bacterium]